jgi:hypothetical protein
MRQGFIILGGQERSWRIDKYLVVFVARCEPRNIKPFRGPQNAIISISKQPTEIRFIK